MSFLNAHSSPAHPAARRWGFLSRAGLNDKSQLCRQIEKYADVYTSRVSNFMRYTPYAYFRWGPWGDAVICDNLAWPFPEETPLLDCDTPPWARCLLLIASLSAAQPLFTTPIPFCRSTPLHHPHPFLPRNPSSPGPPARASRTTAG